MDTKEYTAYQQSLKAYWDLSSSIQSSFELGVEKGLEQGMEEGRQSERENLIKRLHQSDMSTEEIANITELSEAEIQKIVGLQ